MTGAASLIDAKARHRHTSQVIRKLSLHEADAFYLSKIGLPKNAPWTLAFGRPLRLVETGVVIGSDDAFDFELQRTSRAVVIREGKRVRFVNSSLASFGHFLELASAYCRDARGHEEDDALAFVARAETAMRRSDPAALREDAYWSLILEQMRDGSL